MKDFFRSLSYLWPYRRRLIVSAVCVLVIAVLWGGGLGMLAPGLKILVDEEGLHGWAWNTLTEETLGIKTVRQVVPSRVPVEGESLPLTLNIVSVDEDGPAAEAGVEANRWLVGVAGSGQADRVMRGDDLSRLLANEYDPGQKVTLRLYNQATDEVVERTVTLTKPSFKGRILGKVARNIKEPADMPGRFRILVGLLTIAIVITLIRDLMRFTQEYLVETAVWSGVVDMRCEIYNVALRLPVSFYAAQGTSDTMSRFIQDTNELSRGQVTLFGKTLVEPAKAIGSIAMALLFSWKLTLLAMVAGPPAYFLIRRFGKVMKRASRRALESWAQLLAVLEETLAGIRVVKAYTMESAERRRFFRENRRLLKQQKRMARIDAATAPAVEALGVTAGMIAAGAAGYWVLHGQMDPIIFITWMGCLAAMFDPVRKLAKVATRFQRADAAAARIFELRDQEPEPRIPGAPMLPRHSESIQFSNVSFRYPNAPDNALENINLTIQAGQTVAVVGPNGCGKTTLVSLLPRLFDPTEGKIFIDGQDIHQSSLRSLRRQIGVVTQETVLFHATIAENIAYGLRRPKREDVMAAARKAFVDEFVQNLPEGYDTMVGQRGSTLSGGQRQRIAIARAILRNPAILIFDEATSQVDADSEHRIHQAMDQFIKDRTTLMIAHRFATVLAADMIIVMSDGKILETGTHGELLESCKLYRHLYRTQFVDSGG
ncbi:MAG: ATP-binding cassette domain-containing protein [Phycisphaerae bacterium]